MIRWVALAGVAVLLLLYLTMSMAPARPPAEASHDEQGAIAACQKEVETRMESSDFSLSPTVEYQPEARYAVDGVVDGRMNGTDARRNYECAIRYSESEGYMADSVSVWQSH